MIRAVSPTHEEPSAPARRRQRFTGAAALLAISVLSGCATGGLPSGFAAALAAAPTSPPARLHLVGEAIVGAAVPAGPGALPRPVRVAADGIAPGGETVFAGREWGPAGDGFRIEKLYREGADEAFRSVLLDASGDVLERTHSVPLPDVPTAVLATALRVGREVTRCEIVADGSRETGWRATVHNGAGWTFVVAIGLDASLQHVQRVLDARLLAH